MAQGFKLVLVGDGGVGKTAFVARHRTRRFDPRYVATLGVEVHPLVFQTNKGQVTFNVWDCAGQERFSGLKEGYYEGMHCAVVMFSHGSAESYRNAKTWIQALRRVDPGVPIVLCGNKADRGAVDMIRPCDLVRDYGGAVGPDFKYYEMSTKDSVNLEKPFLEYARRFLGEDTVMVVAPEG